MIWGLLICILYIIIPQFSYEICENVCIQHMGMLKVLIFMSITCTCTYMNDDI